MRWWLAPLLVVGCTGAPMLADLGPSECDDGERDGDESDVDCGGSCAPCSNRGICLSDGDCAVHHCVDGRCGGPFCDDGVKNGDESDVDCGGSVCLSCGEGRACNLDGDCLSGSCSDGRCRTSCPDGKRDGRETGVDCGGGQCPACGDGSGCRVNTDCTSLYCDGDSCAELRVLDFGDPVHVADRLGCATVAVGDIDGDGLVDLAVSDEVGASAGLAVLLADGMGGFAAPVRTLLPSQQGHFGIVAIGDLDGDQREDLIVLEDPVPVRVQGTPQLWRFLSTSDGATGFPLELQPLAAAPALTLLGDFNGDKLLDLIVGNGTSVSMRAGDGGGNLLETADHTSFELNVTNLLAADFDGDGRPDVAVVLDNAGASLLKVYSASSEILLGQPVETQFTIGVSALAAGDFDGDGIPDLALAQAGDRRLYIARGHGGNGFDEPVAVPSTDVPSSIFVADFDGDGRADIVHGAYGHAFYVLLNRGGDTFDPPRTFDLGKACDHIVIADVDEDGRPDVISPDAIAGTISWRLNRSH